MKMVPGVFFGALLVVIGITIILNVVFNVNIPVMRIILAVIFIFIGIKLLLGKNIKLFGSEQKETTEVNEQFYTANNKSYQEYNVIFSKSVVDLRSVEFSDNKSVKIHVNNVFGKCEIMLSHSIPVKITSNTAFATVQIPNGSSVVVGSTNYQSDNFDNTKPFIDLKLDVVFANAKLVFY